MTTIIEVREIVDHVREAIGDMLLTHFGDDEDE